MKVVLVNRHPNDVIGGSEMQCDGIATRLSQRGHEVIYVAPAGNKQKDYQTNYNVIAVESDAKTIANVVLDQKPDIVYWRFNKYHFHDAVRLIAKQNIPIVFGVSHVNDTKMWSCRENIFSGVIPFLKGLKQGLLNLYNHFGFKYVDAVTVNNPEHMNLLSIEDQCFVPNSISDNAAPFSWQRPYIVWVSNIKPAKRPELFVELAKNLSDSNVDFLMIGNIQSEQYRWIESENQRTPNFHFLGPKSLEEVNGIIKQSIFLIHTCKPEGFPSVFLQAWLKSKPTITYEYDPGEFISKNKLGGVANNDWTNFVSMTKDLIDNKEERDAAGKRANDFAVDLFAAENTIQILEKLLQKTIDKVQS